MHWVRDAALILALLWLLLVALTTVRAQEPTPGPGACIGIETDGGQTVLLGNVLVMLPEGDFTRTIAPPNMLELGFMLCHVETGDSITISGLACEEIARQADGPAGEALLDAIIASCQVVPAPTPEPRPVFACPEGEVIAGGTTVTIAGNLQVSLPPGNFVIHVNENDIAQICNVDEEFSAYLLVSDCTAPAIAPPNDPHQEAIQEIKASCISLAPTPTPDRATVTNIQPPNTGDAGLKTEN